MKRLIVNGDDFGAGPGVNRGLIEAHRRGILTSASLLVGTPWSAEAAESSRAFPDLSVGLHVDLRGVLEDPRGASPLRVRHAIGAQCARFEALMGRPPTHLDAHHNLHRDPRALRPLLQLSRWLGVPLREHSQVRYFSKFYGRWGGASHPEQIHAASLARMLAREIDEGITELSCHPGYADPGLTSTYSIEREVELRALCDPALRRLLARSAIHLISYHDLGRLEGRRSA